jgi:signal transduction histidine kinase
MTMAHEFSWGDRPKSAANAAARERSSGSRLLAIAGAARALPEMLEAICVAAEESLDRCRCGIYLIDWRGPAFRAGATPSLPASFSAAICGSPVRPGSDPYAQAACSRAQVIVADLASDPSWQGSESHALASEHGLRSCWSTPISSGSGHVLGIFAVLRDLPGHPTALEQDLIANVTLAARIALERAQSETLLRRSTASLAETQRLSHTGSFVWHTATDDIMWSEELYRIFELDAAETVTRDLLASRLQPIDAVPVCDALDRVRNAGSELVQDHRLLMPDQSVKYLRMTAHATRGKDGLLEYIGAVQDVTQHRAAEAELSKARSDLAQMARIISLGPLSASIVHEVNQPLSGIQLNLITGLRMLAAESPDVPGACDAMRRALRDSRRTSEVIARLHTLFTRKEPKVTSVDLNDATQEMLALLLAELQRNRVILHREFQEDLPPVIADRVQLQQVILNLLLNASDAMSSIDERSRLLVVRTESDGADRVRLSVKDSGVGLDFQIVDRLFEPFYTTKRDGMGIGLFVSRFIIERHRGRLEAAPNTGPGATFSFSLPSAGRRTAPS